MAEHLVKTLCHIVFILKLYSKFLLGLFHCPAYLQHAPLPEEPVSYTHLDVYKRQRTGNADIKKYFHLASPSDVVRKSLNFQTISMLSRS